MLDVCIRYHQFQAVHLQEQNRSIGDRKTKADCILQRCYKQDF